MIVLIWKLGFIRSVFRGQMITLCFSQVKFKVILYSLPYFLAYDHKNQVTGQANVLWLSPIRDFEMNERVRILWDC